MHSGICLIIFKVFIRTYLETETLRQFNKIRLCAYQFLSNKLKIISSLICHSCIHTATILQYNSMPLKKEMVALVRSFLL